MIYREGEAPGNADVLVGNERKEADGDVGVPGASPPSPSRIGIAN